MKNNHTKLQQVPTTQHDSRARRTALTALMVSLALIFSYIEFLIPFTPAIPGIKLGIANLVIIVALYYLGMYNDAFTIRDFWHIRTAGWIGLAVVVLVTVWQVIKATRRSVSARRAARQAERDEKTRQKELEDVRTRAYTAGQEDAKAAARVAENVSAAAEDRENG